METPTCKCGQWPIEEYGPICPSCVADERQTLTGSAGALGAWFIEGREADEFEREEILSDLYRFDAYGVSADRKVIIATPNGRAIVQLIDYEGSPLITFEYVRHGRWGKTTFWFNPNSVADLGERLRAAPEKRTDFDTLFIREGVLA